VVRATGSVNGRANESREQAVCNGVVTPTDRHAEIGTRNNVRTTNAPPEGRFFFKSSGSREETSRALSFVSDHRLVKLVYQGSDPTLPYQTLVIRKSVRLSARRWPANRLRHGVGEDVFGTLSDPARWGSLHLTT